jgi:hypothetical protein
MVNVRAVFALVVDESVSVNETSWKPLEAIDCPEPVEVNVTPVGNAPVSVMVMTCADVPVFSMQAYWVCEPGDVPDVATGTDQVCASPVSVYAGVVAAVQVTGFVVPCKEANKFVPTFTTLPVLLIESWVAAYAT